jgi:hypothetical protein
MADEDEWRWIYYYLYIGHDGVLRWKARHNSPLFNSRYPDTEAGKGMTVVTINGDKYDKAEIIEYLRGRNSI